MAERPRLKFLHRANGKYVWKAANVDMYVFCKVAEFWAVPPRG